MQPLLLILLATPHIGGTAAVIDIKTTDVRAALIPLLTEILTTEVSDTGAFDAVIAGGDIRAMLSFEEQKQIIGCDAEASCLAEIGGALGVDRLIVPQVGRVAESYIVTIKLIDIRGARIEHRIYETVRGDEDVLVASLRRSVVKLLADPSAATTVRTAPVVQGTGVPILPVALLAAGTVGLGVGVAFGVKANGHASNAANADFVGAQREIDRSRSSALASNIAYGVGGAFAIGGLVTLLLSSGDAPAATATAFVDDEGAYAAVGGRF